MAKYSDFLNTISSVSGLTISSHFLVDLDGACSAFLLQSILKNSRVVFPDKPSSSVRSLCDKYNLKYSVDDVLNPATTILVDVDDPALIHHSTEPFFAVIDHHHSEGVNSKNKLSEPDAPSTTYILYKLLQSAGVKLNSKQSELILIGIVADTYRFKSNVDKKVLSVSADLLAKSNSKYEEILSFAEKVHMESSERLVFARSFKDYRIYRDRKNKFMFILSDCESFQGLVATRIIESLEADFGMAYTLFQGQVRVSFRSSPRFDGHLGMIASLLGKRLGGSGGGHKHAAGADLPKESFKVVEHEVVNILSNHYSLIEE